MELDWDEIWRVRAEQHFRLQVDPGDWREMAFAHERACSILLERFLAALERKRELRYEDPLEHLSEWLDVSVEEDLLRPAMMLLQLSYECGLKAIIVARGMFAPPEHDLLKMVDVLGVHLTPRQRTYLDRLTTTNTLGRYKTDKGSHGLAWSTADEEIIDELDRILFREFAYAMSKHKMPELTAEEIQADADEMRSERNPPRYHAAKRSWTRTGTLNRIRPES